MTYATEQEAFWAGEFGDEYIARNRSDALLRSNMHFFSKALRSAPAVGSCIELGANIGMNLLALGELYPNLEAWGVEINAAAARQLAQTIPPERVLHMPILDFHPSREWDLVLVKGVLIHINPEMLPSVYDRMFAASGRYVLIAEYYNPTPVAIPYRGHADRLFKRDFAGEMMDRHPGLHLIDYGFAYRRDPAFPQDDITWFLMEKR